MSGDVQPRKRKEKRRKKEDSEEIPSNFSSDEQLHVHKDPSTGGNICAKILFFLLSSVLLVMIGLVVFEYRGSVDDEALVPVSKWASTFDGWLETAVKHDEHADVTESGEQEHGDDLGRSDEIIYTQQKIPGVQEKKIKAISEEDDQPRQKQEKEVSGSAQAVEGTTTAKVVQKPHEKHKNQDQDKSKVKAHPSAVKQKDVTEKPSVAKHKKPKAIQPQEEPASKSGHQARSTEHSAMKNDGFPSGPGETGQGQKAEDLTASKVTPPKQQKLVIETTNDGSSEATLPKKQKDDKSTSQKTEHIPTDHSKPIVSGGKNFKDKDVSSDGVHSPPKASRIGDKVEHSQKGGKSSTLHKVTEQPSPTKLDANDRVSVSKSPHVDKSVEEHTKSMGSKDKQGIKSVHSASGSSVRNIKIDKNDAQKTADISRKASDLKADANAELESARKSTSVDKTVTPANDGTGKETIGVKSGIKGTGSLNPQTKKPKGSHSTDEKKLAGHPSIREKKNLEQLSSKLDHHAESVHIVDVKDSSAAKVHEDTRKSKVGIEKQKADPSSRAKVSDEVSSEVPVKVSIDKVRKVSKDDITKTTTKEKNDDVNAAREKSGVDNTPPKAKHNSRDTKAAPETTSKHSVKKEDDSHKTREVKPNVQSAASHKNNREEELRPMTANENRAGHQGNSGNNKPVNPNVKKPSHGQKVSSQQIENEVLSQSKSEGSSREKAGPSRRNSNSETVK